MEEKKINNKKYIIQMIVLIVGLALLIGGISYATFSWVFSGTLTNTITTTPVELKFLESNTEVISISNALPMSDAEGKLEDSFDFSVTSTTTRSSNINYTLTIQKLTLDTGYSALADNQMKVYLEDYSGTQLVAPTLISNLTSYQLYSGTHNHTSTETVQSKFKLRVWIDESVSSAAQNWTTSTKLQYKFKINISSSES